MPGRVTSVGGSTIATTATGQRRIIIQRRFRRATTDRVDLPAVGDWLALEPVPNVDDEALLRAVLPRAGTFTRNRISDGRLQIIAANIDVAFIVVGLDHDLNVRRIERYLVLARDGGVEPVVVLNKADLVPDLAGATRDVEAVANGARVLAISARDGEGLDQLRSVLAPGMTACLLGSSGVGKSTITNALLGSERQVVRALRQDDSRGRHTTIHREVFMLDGGALLIDTPGLRTVGVKGDAEAVTASFDDIETLAQRCRFSDCTHTSEPGCAVIAALDDGSLDADRLASLRKLEAERSAFEARANQRARRERERSRSVHYARTAREAARLKRGDRSSSSR